MERVLCVKHFVRFWNYPEGFSLFLLECNSTWSHPLRAAKPHPSQAGQGAAAYS